MSSLTDKMNKVSRLVDPAARAEDERARKAAEITECEEFLAQKQKIERDYADAQARVEKLKPAADVAKAQLDAVDIADLQSRMDAIARASKKLDEYVSYTATRGNGIGGSRVFYELNFAFMLARMPVIKGLSFDKMFALERVCSRDDFAKLRAGLPDLLAVTVRLREFFSVIPDIKTPEGKKLFVREEVIGHKTERRAGYPFIFLTEKVSVPIKRNVELSAAEKADVVAGYVAAIDCIENDLPVFMQMQKEIAKAISAIEACENAEQTATYAKAQLDKIPAGLEEKVQCYVAALNKGGVVIKRDRN